ncbi:RagB/SusD family nutrient uptake outer membrane protein [Sphingobacterium sp. 18053]|uniref:RagB/SusD family nutrient uptake outer membrane protein n=1 Tax=Sphingobacterium sp. 18053 TaxID=2681401 RepID=UPI0013576EB4|nr:RagB/SusD family nutrient uptake outer membrane protein [Sphingobacterium sp. 18053]
MKKIHLYFGLALYWSLLCMVSCTKFLDEKSNKALSVPKTINDLQALLDAYGTINSVYSSTGEEASDNYFLSAKNWQGIANQDTRNRYIWQEQGKLNADWISPYKVVFICNTVLEELEVLGKEKSEQDYQRIKGSGLFFRSFALYELASLFAPVYAAENIEKLSIPIRLSTTIEEDTPRGTVGQTYEQILSDLETAAELLPEHTAYINRPTKRTAYALLARIYLAMSDYANALKASTQALSYGKELVDYNSINLTAAAPFNTTNAEIIWMAGGNTVSALLAPARSRVDSILYSSYADNDLRKKAFFTKNADSYYTFKGTYDGRVQGFLFKGLTVDELYLIQAETQVRVGEVQEGLKSLAVLLSNRYVKGTYQPDLTMEHEQALKLVLEERRKELLFRGLRWTDLRRFNLEKETAMTLQRKLDQEVYRLAPDDLTYVFLIPDNVIAIAGFPQNPR